MATYAQTTANRRNSLHSTGPRTESGKAAASRNATTHGLNSDVVLNTVEDATEFQACLERIRAEFQPRTDHEDFLVQQMAQARWKLARAQRFENAAFELMFQQGFEQGEGNSYESCVVSAMLKNGNTLALLQRYAAVAERSYYKAHRSPMPAAPIGEIGFFRNTFWRAYDAGTGLRTMAFGGRPPLPVNAGLVE